MVVMGPSGCGKSTMLHLVDALDRPTSGAIGIRGEDLSHVHDLASYRRPHIGLVFLVSHLVAQLSAQQNVEIAMFGTGLTRRVRRDLARAVGRR